MEVGQWMLLQHLSSTVQLWVSCCLNIGQDLQKEIAAICTDKFNSITRKKLNMVLKIFSLIKRSFMVEMESKAPTLLSLLKQWIQNSL